MKRLLLTLSWLFALAIAAQSQVVLEDFEGGPKLNWNPFGDGTFNGAVPNPPNADPLGINPSAQVGSYTKSGQHDYSLLIAVRDTNNPINLSVNKKVSIQVWAPKATQFIFKLENRNNTRSKEFKQNIAVDSVWMTYTFDFSELSDVTDITKIVIFFDFGVRASTDTYLFDNITLLPADSCTGQAANPNMLDDFECNRNATYADPGFRDITVVDNPDKSGINTSSKVGRYRDTLGEYHAMVIEFLDSVKLEDRNTVKIKVWAPKTGTLLAKFEQGAITPFPEIPKQITEINKWVEYTFDFSQYAGASYSKLVFFFNAGQLPAPGDIYYIDDIQLIPKPAPEPFETFEGAEPDLDWEPLNSNAGTFNGAIANPDKTGINTSNKVGSYTKGNSLTGGLEAFIGTIDLTEFPQLDLQVWAPVGANSLTMQLFSPTQGIEEVTRDITQNQTWVQLSFNFEDFDAVTDFESVRLIFDKDFASTATWYFDNLSQGGATVNPCEGTVANNSFLDDFDCQRNSSVTGGSNQLKIVNNPKVGGINPNALDKVGEYTDPQMDPFAALVFKRDTAFDLSLRNQLYVKIWSPKAVPLGFKLQAGSTPAVEKMVTVTTPNQWVQYVIDFSAQAGTDFKELAIFFNFAVNNPDADVYYIDDVEWRRAPYKGCITTFESPDLSITNWNYFANGTSPAFSVVANPNKSGVNTSNNVGLFVENPNAAGVENFAGMAADLPAPIELGTTRTVKMKVLGPVPNSFVMKMESPVGTALGSGDIRASYTTPGQWQELTWDFSKTAPPDMKDVAVGSQYGRITLIPDIDNKPPTARNYYFDDITVGEGSCTTTGIFDPIIVEALKVMPNPVSNDLLIQNTDKVNLFVIYNAMGQRLSVVQPNGQSNLTISVSHLSQGVYTLAGYDAAGMLIANARFVKQ